MNNNNNNNHNHLSVLSNVQECSISGIFSDLFNNNNNQQHEVKFGDIEGSDFKRLINKKKYKRVNSSKEDNLAIITKPQQQSNTKQYHLNSPDFRPVVHLESDKNTKANMFTGLLSNINFFAPRKDRYFNNDREELSKDIISG